MHWHRYCYRWYRWWALCGACHFWSQSTWISDQNLEAMNQGQDQVHIHHYLDHGSSRRTIYPPVPSPIRSNDPNGASHCLGCQQWTISHSNLNHLLLQRGTQWRVAVSRCHRSVDHDKWHRSDCRVESTRRNKRRKIDDRRRCGSSDLESVPRDKWDTWNLRWPECQRLDIRGQEMKGRFCQQ